MTRIRGEFLAEDREYVYHEASEILGGGGSSGFINVARDAVEEYQPSSWADLDIGGPGLPRKRPKWA